ncbi:acyltransferase domain-containing protein [Streptomyces sp. NPDC001595]|uniref:acyltransferase domain-containing protein n=1 Tax=Streptomyces sp. NPDC001532 TaxID=3154520 RepID=UPI00332DF387
MPFEQRGLYVTRVIDELEPLVAEESGFSLRETLNRPEVVTGFDRVQPVIFAIQLGPAAMWRSHGVEPAAVIGHSMGEVAAAVAAGALGLKDGARVIRRRSRLILRTGGQGLMASVALGRASRTAAGGAGRAGVTVAVVASPENTVVGGDADRVRRLAEEWDARGIGIRVIEVDVASHTAHMDPILPDLADALADVTGRPPRTPFYSTVTDDPRERAAFDAAYSSDNLRRVVCFADAVHAAAEDGHRLFIEIGPHPVLVHPVQATLTAHGHTDTAVVPSLLRDTDDVLAFHTRVAALHCAGHPLGPAERHRDGALADVPPTTWERTRYVVDPSPLREATGALSSRVSHPLTGPHTVDPDGEGRHLWQTRVSPSTLPWLGAHRVDDVAVVPGAALCETAVAAAGDLYGVGPERVVAARGNPDALRAYKEDFLRRHGLLGPRPLHDTGHLTRCRHPDSPLTRGRVLVAGDAAALVDHWSREGISYALRSGDLAGHAAARIVGAAGEAEANAAAEHYAGQINDVLGVEMRASGSLMTLFARSPGLVHTALTSLPPAWRRLDAYIAGRTSVAGIMTTPLARTAVALGTRLPVVPPRRPTG